MLVVKLVYYEPLCTVKQFSGEKNEALKKPNRLTQLTTPKLLLLSYLSSTNRHTVSVSENVCCISASYGGYDYPRFPWDVTPSLDTCRRVEVSKGLKKKKRQRDGKNGPGS